MKRLRWKKDEAITGLAAIGAAPRGHAFHDGTTIFARVSPNGGSWQRPQRGWYWTASVRDESINTCRQPVASESEAKEAAASWVLDRLK